MTSRTDLTTGEGKLQLLSSVVVWGYICDLADEKRGKKWIKRLKIMREKLGVTDEEYEVVLMGKEEIDKKVDTIKSKTVQTLMYLRDDIHILDILNTFYTMYFPSTKKVIMDQYEQELEYDITYEALIASELKYLCCGGSEEAIRHMETAEFRAMCERHHVDKDLRVAEVLSVWGVVVDALLTEGVFAGVVEI